MKSNRSKNRISSYFIHHKTMMQTYAQLASFTRPTRDYFILLTLATLISVIGLLLNSTAVIMGAIWIAPMMGPVLGLSLSLVTQRQLLFRQYLKLILISLFLVLLISYLTGSFFSYLGFTDALLERTKPNILHVFLALLAGFLAAYGRIRHNIADRAFGLAVSVSIFPPLCVVGITAAHGRMDLTAGAALLFGSNLASVLFAAIIAFSLLNFKRYRKKASGYLVLMGLVLTALSFPLIMSFQDFSIKRQITHETEEYLRQETSGVILNEIRNVEIEPVSDPLTIDIYIKSTSNKIIPENAARLKKHLEYQMHRKIRLILHIEIEPIIRLTV